MNAQTGQDQPSDSPDPSPQPISSVPSAPYETVLIKAFDKLTSQVFIFLLAYLILVIGIGVLAPQLTTEVRTLLYVLPVLGIGAYLWQQQRSLASKAKHHGIDVKAGIVTGEARVTGVRADTGNANLPEDVKVAAGVASGKGRVEGVVIGDEEPDKLASDSKYLLETFQQLDSQKRRKLIASAQRLLDEA
jgi:hypothetical protein